MKKLFILFLSAFFFYAVIIPAKDLNFKKLSAQIKSKLDSLTINHIVPGITFSCRFNDNKSISLASGYSDIEENIKMIADAVMFSGSVGKTFVAAAVLKLKEQNLINLDNRVIDILTDQSWINQIPNINKITIRMLLNHTAGIPEYIENPLFWDEVAKDRDKNWTPEERFNFVYNRPATNPPGKGWSYADSHYLLLGMIIEKITAKTYYNLIREWFIEPLKLKNTSPADKRKIKGLVQGYTCLTEDFKLPRKMLQDSLYAMNPQIEWTGGGLVTTVSDLTLWAQNLYGGKILSAESLDLMCEPVPFQTGLFENAGYGLGCIIGNSSGTKYFGHTGFAPGYITYLHYLPEYKVSISIQFNEDCTHSGQNMKEFFNLLKKIVVKNIREAENE